MIAVGSDDGNQSAGGKVQLFEFNEASRKWLKVETISIITDSVRDVAFAPNLGRSYHMLAIAAKDVSIITLKPLRRDPSSAAGAAGVTKLESILVAQFREHASQVWRLSWNITGTILVSSGDDGCVRLWKANYLDNWKRIAEIRGDGSSGQIEKTQSSGSYGSSTGTSQGSTSGAARYLKAGPIANKNQVVWH